MKADDITPETVERTLRAYVKETGVEWFSTQAFQNHLGLGGRCDPNSEKLDKRVRLGFAIMKLADDGKIDFSVSHEGVKRWRFVE